MKQKAGPRVFGKQVRFGEMSGLPEGQTIWKAAGASG